MNTYTLKLEAKIYGTPERERVLRQVLSKLPESNVERIAGFAEAVSAIERLQAAEQLKKQSEKDLSSAFQKIRHYVQSNWKASEISDDTKDILMVW